MGNLLSFPLLCLTNYIAFKMSVRRHVPLRINGDDIVFRCTLKEFEIWAANVRKAGLVLSKGKTLVHHRFFSLNSTFFEGRKQKKPSLVPVIRSKSIFGSVDDGMSLGSRLIKSCQGFWKEAKCEVRKEVLRWHRKAALHCGCSINRGLGVVCDVKLLNSVGLLDREYHYLSFPEKVDVPTQRKGKDAKPAVFSRVLASRATKELQQEWVNACIELAWSKRSVAEAEIEPPIVGYRAPWWRGKELDLLKQSSRSMRRLRNEYVRRVGLTKKLGRRKRRGPELAWVPVENVPALSEPRFVACT
jgi:hypothetical protein